MRFKDGFLIKRGLVRREEFYLDIFVLIEVIAKDRLIDSRIRQNRHRIFKRLGKIEFNVVSIRAFKEHLQFAAYRQKLKLLGGIKQKQHACLARQDL